MGVRRGGPALAGIAARRVAPSAGRAACARERGAEAASGFDRALGGAQVVFGIGGEPEEAGEAATIGHAPTTRGAASAPCSGYAFPARSYLFVGTVPHPAAAPSRASDACTYCPRRTRLWQCESSSSSSPSRPCARAAPCRAVSTSCARRPGASSRAATPTGRAAGPTSTAARPSRRRHPSQTDRTHRARGSSLGFRPSPRRPVRRDPRGEAQGTPNALRVIPATLVMLGLAKRRPEDLHQANLRRGPRVAAVRRPTMTTFVLDFRFCLCSFAAVPPGRGAPPEVSGRGAASREEGLGSKGPEPSRAVGRSEFPARRGASV
jgi:hypothetical protein